MKRQLPAFYGKTKLTRKSSLVDDKDDFSNVKECLQMLKSLFPIEKFDNKLPPIIMKHQIYTLMKNRTEVDKELDSLLNEGEIRIFKLGRNNDEFAIVFMKDYEDHLNRLCKNNEIIVRFLNKVIKEYPDISYSRKTLIKYGFKEEDISELVQTGVLIIRDAGCWWLDIPGSGEFIKSHTSGRKAILRSIQQTKYKEILQSELEQRKLTKAAKLGMEYHIYDIIGADMVKCIDTTSGKLLRLER
ncbi:serine/threonine-protein kinase 19-like [Centruroides sculpturatus]|uniref:serine/threonine-protein kinase 19-like n=1 Tax=Centruroides sculpturatus TaxID=218467 RepID=UPI000C6D3481|nr:serine/threonine-protein kinase 19-like [Centruroides sculpturatus]